MFQFPHSKRYKKHDRQGDSTTEERRDRWVFQLHKTDQEQRETQEQGSDLNQLGGSGETTSWSSHIPDTYACTACLWICKSTNATYMQWVQLQIMWLCLFVIPILTATFNSEVSFLLLVHFLSGDWLYTYSDKSYTGTERESVCFT